MGGKRKSGTRGGREKSATDEWRLEKSGENPFR